MRGRRAWLLLLCAFLCFTAERWAAVEHAVDGDTVRLTDGTRVRLIGINTPEYEPWRAFVEPFGKEASEFTHKLVDGKAVRLEYDRERKDRYGRTLAYLYLKDGTFVNKMLIDEGLARTLYVAPNGKHYADLKAAERAAKVARRGMWARR